MLIHTKSSIELFFYMELWFGTKCREAQSDNSNLVHVRGFKINLYRCFTIPF
jgi:hypothetical protein